MDNLLTDYITNSGGLNIQAIKRDNLVDKINNMILDNITFIEKCYWIYHNITRPVLCKACNNKVLLKNFKLGYQHFCCLKCSNNYTGTKEKYKETCLKKYGVNSFNSLEKVKQQKIQSSLKKYGVPNPSQAGTVKEKKKQTCLLRFGEITNLNTQETRRKIKQTLMRKYGVEHYSKTDLYKEKCKNTNNSKYGSNYYKQSNEYKELTFDKIKTRLQNIVIPMFTLEEYTTIYKKYKWKCAVCNNQFEDSLISFRTPRCLECYPYNRSIGEQEVASFVRNVVKIIENDRTILKPLELDIYIPSKKIAIEYCGLYWHSNLKRSSEYHQDKWQKCKDQGIRLITIFEDEWLNKQDICKSRIKYALGLGDKICYARQTEIKEIQPKEYREFLEKTHIQGSVNSKIKLGAFYKDQLVAVMGFGKKRKILGHKLNNDKSKYELLRFATLGNIPGIGSKLFKRFIKDLAPKEIISYCDLRWGTGGFYKQLGMTYVYVTTPNFFYIENNIRKSRYIYQKHKLVEQGFSKDKTANEIMSSNGFLKIYDCGSIKLIWKKSKR